MIPPTDVKREPRGKYETMQFFFFQLTLVLLFYIETTTSPYLTPTYGGISPAYVQNPCLSPNLGQQPITLQSNQGQNINYNIQQPMDFMVVGNEIKEPLPSLSSVGLSTNWNIPLPSSSNYQNNLSMDTSASLLLDMDTKALEEIKSDDLRDLNLPDMTNNLSESFTNNLSLTDIQVNNNMTDSLTRLANSTIDDIVKLTDMNSFK